MQAVLKQVFPWLLWKQYRLVWSWVRVYGIRQGIPTLWFALEIRNGFTQFLHGQGLGFLKSWTPLNVPVWDGKILGDVIQPLKTIVPGGCWMVLQIWSYFEHSSWGAVFAERYSSFRAQDAEGSGEDFFNRSKLCGDDVINSPLQLHMVARIL